MLLFTTRLFPDMSAIPDFRTQRNKHLTIYLGRHGGVTPFTLERSETAESWEQERNAALERSQASSSVNSVPEITERNNRERPKTPLLE